MGELIYIRERARRRDIARSDARDHASLRRAVDILKENLHTTSAELLDAPSAEQAELLNRAERFIAMIRYGMRMLGEDDSEPQALIEKK